MGCTSRTPSTPSSSAKTIGYVCSFGSSPQFTPLCVSSAPPSRISAALTRTTVCAHLVRSLFSLDGLEKRRLPTIRKAPGSPAGASSCAGCAGSAVQQKEEGPCCPPRRVRCHTHFTLPPHSSNAERQLTTSHLLVWCWRPHHHHHHLHHHPTGNQYGICRHFCKRRSAAAWCRSRNGLSPSLRRWIPRLP